MCSSQITFIRITMGTLQVFTYLGAILTYWIEIPGLVALEPAIKKKILNIVCTERVNEDEHGHVKG